MRLGVNVDHVATIRQARKTFEPSPVFAALIAQQAGADQITLHLREDRRHIQDRDLELIRELIKIPVNLEMAPTEEMREIALRVKPDRITLVPERREEITTEGGLDVLSMKEYLKDYLKPLKEEGIEISLFIEAQTEQIDASTDVGADAVEIHTGRYANLWNEHKFEEAKELIDRGLVYAQDKKLKIARGLMPINLSWVHFFHSSFCIFCQTHKGKVHFF
ncbi:MAG TPA: pyridoxine 5'-phosphate synthase [Aquificaceae bacterium]|nr:pyridoxine 5'-phosphate synthase [Aquificaceae bacterium]